MTAAGVAAPARRGWHAVGRRGLLIVLSGNMLIDAIEVSMAMISLPSIQHDLRLSLIGTQWVVGGFALGFGGMLMPGRWAAARWGYRRVYLTALAVFAVASAIAALSPDGAVLIATRVIKGGCAALTAPAGLAIIAGTFPAGRPRTRALAIYTLLGASGFSAGLLLAGVLTPVSWRWTFALPAPLALALFPFALRLIPPGVGKDQAGRLGRTGVLAIACLRRAALGAATLNGSYWGLLFVVIFHLQVRLGWGPLEAGAALLPASLPAAMAAPLAEPMMRRVSPARLVALGAALPPLGYGLCLITFSGYRAGGPAVTMTAYAERLLPALLLVGLGFALCFASLHVQALAGVPAVHHRVASSAYQTCVQVGGAAVLAAAAVVLTRAGERPALALLVAVGGLGFLALLPGVRGSKASAP